MQYLSISSLMFHILLFVGACVLILAHLAYVGYKQSKDNNWPHPFIKTSSGISVAPLNQVQIDYDILLSVIEGCETNEQLSSACKMLQSFERKYGKCDKYCELYATYVGMLFTINEYNEGFF